MATNHSTLAGIYLHIPFCERKCAYCDFYSLTDLPLRSRFVDALCREIELRGRQAPADEVYDTIYFGGGTPSLLSARQISQILETLHTVFTIADRTEITLEANPGTMEQQMFADFFAAGVNRLSLGVQSFNDHELRFLGRIHTAAQATSALQRARQAGFDNLSLDLIYALPGQTTESWHHTLQQTFDFGPEHISAYNLIFEPGTPFYSRMQKGQIQAQPEAREIDFWNYTLDAMQANGYEAYEVSNFARSAAFYSRHNVKYWRHVPYLGFGPSAHSFRETRRWSNVRSLSTYLTEVEQGNLPVDFEETLDASTLEFEHILLRLRMYAGLHLTEFKRKFGSDFLEKYKAETGGFLERKLAETENGYFKLTRKGMLICDEILQDFYRP